MIARDPEPDEQVRGSSAQQQPDDAILDLAAEVDVDAKSHMNWRPPYKNVVRQLSTPSLYAEILKLDNSIRHLKRSNEELILHGESEEDGQWTVDIVKENKDVIAKQEEQIEMVKAEIAERGQSGHAEIEVGDGDDKVQGRLNENGMHRGEEQGEPMILEEDNGLHL